MKHIHLLIALLSPGPAAAQQSDSIYSAAQMPEFPGDKGALIRYLSQHLKYTGSAKEEGIQTSLCVTFIITKEGRTVKPQVQNPKGTAFEHEVKNSF